MATDAHRRTGSVVRPRRTTYRQRSSEPFGVGYVISESGKIFFRSFPGFIGLALLVIVPTFALASVSIVALVDAARRFVDPSLFVAIGPTLGAGVMTLWLLAGWALLHTFVLAGVNQRLRGQPLRLGRCIRFGFSRFGASLLTAFLIVLVVTVLFLLGAITAFMLGGLVGQALEGEPFETRLATTLWTMFGSSIVFAIIPSVALGCMYWVAMPVAVAERRAGTGAMSRSVHLTRGYRWPIFAVVLIQGLTEVAARVSVTLMAPGVDSGGTALVFLLVLGAIELVMLTWMAIAGGVAYHRLRFLKEGAEVDVIARVFD